MGKKFPLPGAESGSEGLTSRLFPPCPSYAFGFTLFFFSFFFFFFLIVKKRVFQVDNFMPGVFFFLKKTRFYCYCASYRKMQSKSAEFVLQLCHNVSLMQNM